MNRSLERLKQEHRRLDRLIDTCRSALRQSEMKSFKQARLRLKDRIAQLQRSVGPSTP